MRRNTRGIDLTCRLGGEEFVVVMPDSDLPRPITWASACAQCIAAAPFEVRGRTGTLQVMASVGVAAIEPPATLVLKRADQALYCAKRDGRNRVVADAA
jgi:two-component system, cell cycle response regulator